MPIKITFVKKKIKGKFIPLGTLNVCGRNTHIQMLTFQLTKSGLREGGWGNDPLQNMGYKAYVVERRSM